MNLMFKKYWEIWTSLKSSLEMRPCLKLLWKTVKPLADCMETDAQQDAAKPVEQSQAWADSTEDEIEEFSKAGSEKPQEAKLKEKSGMKSYCTRCRVDFHSEDECCQLH